MLIDAIDLHTFFIDIIMVATHPKL